ncbi:MAG: hypothetical protein QT07_C0001G0042 [archaeon GW2011_AR16]|nr:MAG: hypothetical protein QT07_C0001G0042 [archaeon GW2011_AR16]
MIGQGWETQQATNFMNSPCLSLIHERNVQKYLSHVFYYGGSDSFLPPQPRRLRTQSAENAYYVQHPVACSCYRNHSGFKPPLESSDEPCTPLREEMRLSNNHQ